MNTLGTAFQNGFKLGIHTEDVEAPEAEPARADHHIFLLSFIQTL